MLWCQNCAAHLILKTKTKQKTRQETGHITPLFQSFHWLPIPQTSVQDKHSTINVLYTQLCLISVTVFNFTHSHTHVLSVLLLILSASVFLVIPDFPLLVPEPFLPLAPLHEMTFPFLSDRNPLWTPSGHFISENSQPATFSVPRCCLPLPQISVCCLFKLCVN